MRILLLSLLSTTVAFSQSMDSAALGARIAAAHDANAIRTRSWSYREHQVTVQTDKNGKKQDDSTQTWEVIGLEGAPYRRLMERDDHPLSAGETRKQEEAMRREGAARRESRRRGLPRIFSTTYSLSMPWDKLSEVYDLTVSGEETISGHPVHVVDGVPRKQPATARPREREAANYKVRMWILKSDALPVRTTMEIVGTDSRMKSGSRLLTEQFPAEDGTWLPKKADFDFVLKVVGLFSVHGLSSTTYAEFKKFQVDSNIVADDKAQ